MRLIKLFSLFLICCWVSDFAIAKTLQVSLKLAEIRIENSNEESGDELYFNITQYSSLGSSQNVRVPVYPAHWLYKQINKIKNVVLWQGSIQEGEEIQLIISLIEQDSPPWDTDDGIGSAAVTLHNVLGKLTEKWEIPSFSEKEKVNQLDYSAPQKYLFMGSNARYDVAFLIEQK